MSKKHGRVASENDAFTQWMAHLVSTVECPTCCGRGWYLGPLRQVTCYVCKGSGRVREGARLA